MPEFDLARLGRDLDLMRSGRGERRTELRRLLGDVDGGLRKARNIERLRQAELQRQMRTLDTRRHPDALAALLQATDACGQRLALLDQQIVREIARRLVR